MKVLLTGGSGFIGTHLVDALLARGVDVLNLDIRPPWRPEHHRSWHACDILDAATLDREVAAFAPAHVVHLAARVDIEGRTLDEYRVNTDGTANVLRAVQRTASVERLVVTSSLLVHEDPGLPVHDLHFAAHTAYGQSKVITEQHTRQADLPCVWTIIRPTNIWGPWHPRYPSQFWNVLGRGRYVHPGRQRTIRAFGYVGNVVFQILCLLSAPGADVDRRVFYVGDRPINLYDWVNGFSLQQVGRPARVAPRWCIKALAAAGELLARAGVPSPITMTRYRNMTVSNAAPMDPIYELCGEPPYSLEAGIAETVRWLYAHHPRLVVARLSNLQA